LTASKDCLLKFWDVKAQHCVETMTEHIDRQPLMVQGSPLFGFLRLVDPKHKNILQDIPKGKPKLYFFKICLKKTADVYSALSGQSLPAFSVCFCLRS
jgi:hypothetical protein